jgi:hypothetical protein
MALQIARSLQSQFFFREVYWPSRMLQDSAEYIYTFLDDMDGGSEAGMGYLEELPSGVILLMTKCYSPGCSDEDPCYASTCPRKVGCCFERRELGLTPWLQKDTQLQVHMPSVIAAKPREIMSQLLAFQSSMGKGAAGKLQWYDLVAEDMRPNIHKAEALRQPYVHFMVVIFLFAHVMLQDSV